MEKKLFADLVELMDVKDVTAGGLDEVMRKHATKAQMKILDQPVAKTVKTDAKKVAADTLVKTVSLTGYGHKAAAEQDAQQMLHPNVYAYRTALFPNPQAHGVTVTITRATPVECKKFVNPMYKWGIDLAVEVSGPEAKAKNWLAAFENKVRVTNK